MALKKDLIRVSIKDVPDRPGIVATIFGKIAAANIVVDDIIQTIDDNKTANVSFTLEHGDLADIKPIVEALLTEIGSAKSTARFDADLAKVSVRRRRHAGPTPASPSGCSPHSPARR